MSIERANFNVPSRVSEQSLPDRYQQPPAMTRAGQIDRRHESQHVVRMRDMQREAIERATEQAKQEFELTTKLESRGRTLTEIKYRLLRNRKETQVLAAEDTILQAQYAVLDDDYFRDTRIDFTDWK